MSSANLSLLLLLFLQSIVCLLLGLYWKLYNIIGKGRGSVGAGVVWTGGGGPCGRPPCLPEVIHKLEHLSTDLSTFHLSCGQDLTNI